MPAGKDLSLAGVVADPSAPLTSVIRPVERV
jgi:hypothetical protein